MRAKQLFGITVLDKKVKAVGKVDDVDIDVESGKVTSLIISLQKLCTVLKTGIFTFFSSNVVKFFKYLSAISSPAAFVKVTLRILEGSSIACESRIVLSVRTVVFPLPGPANVSAAPVVCIAISS